MTTAITYTTGNKDNFDKAYIVFNTDIMVGKGFYYLRQQDRLQGKLPGSAVIMNQVQAA